MFVVGRPQYDLFRPYVHTPTIAYWVMEPQEDDVDNEKENTPKKGKTLTKKKQEPDSKATNTFCRTMINDFEIQEHDGEFILSTDLPGVKHADLTVQFHDGALHIDGERKKGGGMHQTFHRKLAVSEDAINVNDLTATLEDGILTLKAPKKKIDKKEGEANEEGRKVEVKSQEPPKDDVTNKELDLEVDLPGVKATDVVITLATDGMLHVSAKRKRAGSDKHVELSEAFLLNARKVDTSKVQAYLADGVLTLRAPARVRVIKTIPVNGELPPPPKKAKKEEKAVMKETKKEEEKKED